MPLEPFFLTHPFTLSAALSTFAGFIFVPIVDSMRIHQVLRKEGPASHMSKRGTPTMGGLFFVPIGIIVASIKAGERSTAVSGAAVATIAFAAIGLLDDLLSCIKSHNYGLPGWAKLGLQVQFSIYLYIRITFASKEITRIIYSVQMMSVPRCFYLIMFVGAVDR